jgi:ribosomal protein S18 acetylase RimI-like enzyme
LQIRVSSTGFTVRTAASADFAAVEALLVDVYLGERYSDLAIEPWLRDVAGHAAAAELLVAADEATEAILGTVCFVTPDAGLAQIAQEGEAEFRLLAVAPAARGRGAGEALVKRCIALAQGHGCTRLVLSTQPSMSAAQRLYERLGFERLPERDWRTDSGGERLVYGLAI